jgi:hypothetical protein
VTSTTEAALFDSDPVAEPLTYPGRIPEASGLLINDRFIPLRPVEGVHADRWSSEFDGASTPLAKVVEQLGYPPLAVRHPVVAVGSNAAPSQMLRKFLAHSVPPFIPLTLADVHGIAPGVSAHVSKAGYVPAAPVETPGRGSRLFVLWLDDRQLQALDSTEPNYRRRLMPTDQFPVTLESGTSLPSCFVYVGKHGCLVDRSERPRLLRDQRTLISSLLEESPGLQKLCGATPEDFVERVQDPVIRDAVRRLFRNEGRAQRQSGLDRLVHRGGSA